MKVDLLQQNVPVVLILFSRETNTAYKYFARKRQFVNLCFKESYMYVATVTVLLVFTIE
jgi:hypothetical protein